MDYERIARAFFSEKWAIQEEKLDELVAFVTAKCAGADLPEIEAIEPREAYVLSASDGSEGGKMIGVLPIYGTISHRANLLTKYSGGTSLEMASKQLRAMASDSSIGAIALDIDSPGGSVFGLEEFAAELRRAREKKHIVAIANPIAASAAYWIASQASEIVVTPSGEVGSIGVIGFHNDMSAALDREGIKVTMIKAGRFKGEGWPQFPLAEEAKDYAQQQVDQIYAKFAADVAKGRGVKMAEVTDGFGEGRMVLAKSALKTGMVDTIATLDETIERLQNSKELPQRESRLEAPSQRALSDADSARLMRIQ